LSELISLKYIFLKSILVYNFVHTSLFNSWSFFIINKIYSKVLMQFAFLNLQSCECELLIYEEFDVCKVYLIQLILSAYFLVFIILII